MGWGPSPRSKSAGIPTVSQGLPPLTTRWKEPWAFARTALRSAGVITPEVGWSVEETLMFPYSAKTLQVCDWPSLARVRQVRRSCSVSTGRVTACSPIRSRNWATAVSWACWRIAERASR